MEYGNVLVFQFTSLGAAILKPLSPSQRTRYAKQNCAVNSNKVADYKHGRDNNSKN